VPAYDGRLVRASPDARAPVATNATAGRRRDLVMRYPFLEEPETAEEG
jgi:hypothetical protein